MQELTPFQGKLSQQLIGMNCDECGGVYFTARHLSVVLGYHNLLCIKLRSNSARYLQLFSIRSGLAFYSCDLSSTHPLCMIKLSYRACLCWVVAILHASSQGQYLLYICRYLRRSGLAFYSCDLNSTRSLCIIKPSYRGIRAHEFARYNFGKYN